MKNTLLISQDKLTKTMFSAATIFLAMTAVHASDVYDDPFEGEGFVKDNWQVVCDNTLTCRAAGYSEDGTASGGATILLTVTPKESAVKAKLKLQNVDDVETSPANAWLASHGSRVSLYLNDKKYGMVELDSASLSGDLSTGQTQQLLARAKQNTKIEFRSGPYRWHVSDSGLSAVLLKLDESQGRVGTPLALVSKNNQPSMTPKSAIPIPKIVAAPVYSTEDSNPNIDLTKMDYWRANIENWIITESNDELKEECYALNSDEKWSRDGDWTLTALNAKYTLASHVCWRGAYNEGIGFWVIDDAIPSKPSLVTYSGGSYDEGQIISGHRGRGLGDCIYLKEWTWNGSSFVNSRAIGTGLCRMIQLGGAWDMPSYVSEVIEADKP
ncbi:MAG: DUF1176 domain-containing protein [Psychrobacter sp.]|uniref:DUF1176 domain-containing protein n=1 Tax=unclassified Psychrobacter TaxID=196806 RepID=UPI003F988867